MRLYELIIENENIDEVFAISLVHDPAIESNGVFFNKDKVMFAEVDKEERLFMAPVLIPNKYILRVDGEGVPYHVYFKPETVKRLSQMYLEKKYTDKATLEHEKPIDGVSLVESWIVESGEKDKSKLYGLSVPTGTWMGTFRITNDKIWEDYVKTGKVKGFSIEGLFEHKLSEPLSKGDLLLSNELSLKNIEDLTEEEAKELLNVIHSLMMPEVELQEPSITSTYPGEVASGSISPATFAEAPEMNVFGYETSHFYICPGAVGTFNHLVNEMNITDDDLVDMIRASAVIADTVFMIEDRVIKEGKGDERDLRRAEVLVEMFKDIFQTVNERTGMEHDISYMDGHIEVIKSYL